jgi:glyceraldehyde 3-phosphate dehydrogenase
MSRIRIGLMGFGQIGRQLYEAVHENEAFADRFEIAVVSDIGQSDILHHLLQHELRDPRCRLDGNFLDNGRMRTRLLRTDQPHEVPWDAYAVDAVVDATARFRSRADMQAHLDNGARRVVLSALPLDHIDRIVVPGVNESDAAVQDRMVCAGSGTTTALALLLKVLSDRFGIEVASMTTVHAYTSDQSLQDYAGPDYRRSRSGAENIIPNSNDAPAWVERILPKLAGKLSGYALNVPVQRGSLLDLNVVFEDPAVGVAEVNAAMNEAARKMPRLIGVAHDPIVSSDVIGCTQSVLFDEPGTIKAGRRLVKLLGWYETRGHANRILDVIAHYAALDGREAA